MRVFHHVTLLLTVQALAAVSAAGAQTTVSGWYTETRVTVLTVGENGILNSAPKESFVREWLSPLGKRVEGDFLALTADPAKGYRLTRRGEAVLYAVDPVQRTVRVFDAQAMRPFVDSQVLGVVARAASMTPKLDAPGGGGFMLGHRTVRQAITYDVLADPRRTTASPSRKRTVTTWTARDTADGFVAAYLRDCQALDAFLRSTPCGKVLRREQRAEGPAGFTTITTSEVVIWRREEIDIARFAVPAGYTRIDAAAEMQARQAQAEELKRLIKSTNPRDRARAKALSDSLFQKFWRSMPPPRPLRDDPSAIVIDGGAKKKP